MPIITVVGCGPGGADYVTPAAQQAIRQADLVVGTNHLLELLAPAGVERVPVGIDIAAVLDTVVDEQKRGRKVAVLVTGDPGLASLAAPLRRRVGRDQCHVIPGISSLQLACARLGVDWTSARIIKAHGQVPQVLPQELESAPCVVILCGPGASWHWVQRLVSHLSGPRRIGLCQDLSWPAEQVRWYDPAELAKVEDVSSRTVAVVLKEEQF
jgi:precorrin-6y C5,15-methyltransferase (decarboxylating) CbiE subunit